MAYLLTPGKDVVVDLPVAAEGDMEDAAVSPEAASVPSSSSQREVSVGSKRPSPASPVCNRKVRCSVSNSCIASFFQPTILGNC